MSDTIISISLNQSEGLAGMIRGYQSGDPLQKVFTFQYPDHLSYGDSYAKVISVLEEIFDLGNILESDYYRNHRLHQQAVSYRTLGNRSLSVGDVVVINTSDGFTQIFAVGSSGWRRLSITEKALSQ